MNHPATEATSKLRLGERHSNQPVSMAALPTQASCVLWGENKQRMQIGTLGQHVEQCIYHL